VGSAWRFRVRWRERPWGSCGSEAGLRGGPSGRRCPPRVGERGYPFEACGGGGGSTCGRGDEHGDGAARAETPGEIPGLWPLPEKPSPDSGGELPGGDEEGPIGAGALALRHPDAGGGPVREDARAPGLLGQRAEGTRDLGISGTTTPRASPGQKPWRGGGAGHEGGGSSRGPVRGDLPVGKRCVGLEPAAFATKRSGGLSPGARACGLRSRLHPLLRERRREGKPLGRYGLHPGDGEDRARDARSFRPSLRSFGPGVPGHQGVGGEPALPGRPSGGPGSVAMGPRGVPGREGLPLQLERAVSGLHPGFAYGVAAGGERLRGGSRPSRSRLLNGQMVGRPRGMRGRRR
jgi:hypothetical protein